MSIHIFVQAFVVDAQQFRSDFELHGPMVPGIEPMDAYERLKKFQRLFEERERKWTTYADGEDLFGLPVTEYPELVKSKKELELLDRLYSLYLTVLSLKCGQEHAHLHTHRLTHGCKHTRVHARTHGHTHTRTHACARSHMAGDLYHQWLWRHPVD